MDKDSGPLIDKFVEMFGCDAARIITPCGRPFLIIGFNRNTRQDTGQWTRNGEPIEFDYLQETVIASGDTEAELIESAKKYKRLLGQETNA